MSIIDMFDGNEAVRPVFLYWLMMMMMMMIQLANQSIFFLPDSKVRRTNKCQRSYSLNKTRKNIDSVPTYTRLSSSCVTSLASTINYITAQAVIMPDSLWNTIFLTFGDLWLFSFWTEACHTHAIASWQGNVDPAWMNQHEPVGEFSSCPKTFFFKNKSEFGDENPTFWGKFRGNIIEHP